MVSTETQAEIEEYLGQVPSWIEALPAEAADNSWHTVRDLQFGETELSQREKALVALSAAAAIQCPYCTHFHTEEAKLEDVTETELAEAVAVASDVRYFSTVLHGMSIDQDAFETETAEIVEHVKNQQAAAPSDD
ncbi:carboxymuconolactone decarboxylase family protein [Natronorubrum sp. JWXQ-INN-674]|uniref:Carboxymuconolactone decarboxylase family protein n=1 Tax=Natronorubrum halalkaliphilum TaxID=2691917 RepID=A0A6B0VMR8_9EURY|nr:carboxymuconolactone decarboxylase family protein [Natronorubrum halalkaliphilum]MXV62503.1 carboxymuconolactone decarboxylase family protein [Natronorubrum halalkaliphilum]